MSRVFLLVGVPGSGKSWVASQLTQLFEVVPHDSYIGQDYVAAIVSAVERSTLPVLAETPFSVSQITQSLEQKGIVVVSVFIIEEESILQDRWDERDTPWSARKGHLTRQTTYKQRAREFSVFCGTSAEVLSFLQGV